MNTVIRLIFEAIILYNVYHEVGIWTFVSITGITIALEMNAHVLNRLIKSGGAIKTFDITKTKLHKSRQKRKKTPYGPAVQKDIIK